MSRNRMQSAQQMPISNLPVSHIATQQSSASVAGQAVAAPASTTDPEKTKVIRERLVLLLHAHKCQRRENQSNGEVSQCTLSHCRTIKRVLSHMTSCSAGKLCPVTHCSSSRQVIAHWKNCTVYDCPICLPLKQAPDREQAAANVQTNQTLAPDDIKRTHDVLELPFNAGDGNASITPVIQRSQNVAIPRVTDQATQCSPQDIPTQQTAQNPQSRVSTGPLLQNGSTNAIGHQPAQNFLLADNLQSNITTDNVALMNAPPTVPGAVPNNPTVVKDWHQSVTPDFRHHLVQEIVQFIFPTTGISTLQVTRLINLVAYAQKVEGGVYSTANSKEEYYQLLAEKICEIQEEHEEKKQKANELQMQQQQVGSPNLAPMFGNNAAMPIPDLSGPGFRLYQPHLSNLTVPANQWQMPAPNVTVQTNSTLPRGSELFPPSGSHLSTSLNVTLNQSQFKLDPEA